MKKHDVIESLREFSSDLPRAALKEIQENCVEYIPELLISLEYVYTNAEALYKNRSNYFMHMYAMYLLSEFREKQAFPYLIKLLHLPSDQLDFITGDTLTDGYARMLLSTYSSEYQLALLEVIENPDLHEWARSAAIDAYELLYREGFISRAEIVSYLRSLVYEKLPSDDSNVVFSGISGCVIDSKLYDLIPDVQYLYDMKRIDIFVHGRYDDFIDWMFHNKDHRKPNYINDTIAEMEWWSSFNENRGRYREPLTKGLKDLVADGVKKDREQELAFAQKVSKTGRNDPCHCGSGKKYKKCCYDADRSGISVARLEDKYDLLESYPKESQQFREMFDEEAINIDMLVYKALHHRSIPMWVVRDYEQERLGMIHYLREALNLFTDKCRCEHIASFTAFDEKYKVHYRSNDWVFSLIDLIEETDPSELLAVGESAAVIYREFKS